MAENESGSNTVILFDGVCNLCNGAVQFILRRDRKKVFRFASLQSAFANRELASFYASGVFPDSIVLLYEGRVLIKSDAALRIASLLGAPWSYLSVFRFFPRFLRDGVYDLIARNRYRWFGRTESCMMPTPDVRHRFLDE